MARMVGEAGGLESGPMRPDLDLEQLVERYNQAWNYQNLDEIAALHAPTSFPEPHGGRAGRGGRRCPRAPWWYFERWPDLRFRGRRLYAGADFVVSEWTAIATHADGRRLQWDGIDVFPFHDGLMRVRTSTRARTLARARLSRRPRASATEDEVQHRLKRPAGVSSPAKAARGG